MLAPSGASRPDVTATIPAPSIITAGSGAKAEPVPSNSHPARSTVTAAMQIIIGPRTAFVSVARLWRNPLAARIVSMYQLDISDRRFAVVRLTPGGSEGVQRAVVRHDRNHLHGDAAHRAADRVTGLGRARRRADGGECRGWHRFLRAPRPRGHRGGTVGGHAGAASGGRGAVRDRHRGEPS